MVYLIILLTVFFGLHFVMMLPVQLAIMGSGVLTVFLWIAWKLKWMILGIIGLEELFGGRGDGI